MTRRQGAILAAAGHALRRRVVAARRTSSACRLAAVRARLPALACSPSAARRSRSRSAGSACRAPSSRSCWPWRCSARPRRSRSALAPLLVDALIDWRGWLRDRSSTRHLRDVPARRRPAHRRFGADPQPRRDDAPRLRRRSCSSSSWSPNFAQLRDDRGLLQVDLGTPPSQDIPDRLPQDAAVGVRHGPAHGGRRVQLQPDRRRRRRTARGRPVHLPVPDPHLRPGVTSAARSSRSARGSLRRSRSASSAP